MSFSLLPKIAKVNYLYEPLMDSSFMFPITGLEIEDKMSIGNVAFYNISGTSFSNEIKTAPFRPGVTLFHDAKTVAFVDTSCVNVAWKSQCNDNLTIALMLIKQAIGFLYLTYYEIRGYNDQRRIIISANNKHESEEGMDFFITNKGVRGSDITRSLILMPSKAFLEKVNDRIGAFLDLYGMDNELKLKKLKLFESLYYMCNEIHSLERVLKMSAFLNFAFIPSTEDNDFPNVAKKVKVFLDMYSIQIDMFEKTGKLNSILFDIYNKIRSQYSHGKIDLFREFNMISDQDYFIFYQSYMNALILLAYKPELQNIQTTVELLTHISAYRPSQPKG